MNVQSIDTDCGNTNKWDIWHFTCSDPKQGSRVEGDGEGKQDESGSEESKLSKERGR